MEKKLLNLTKTELEKIDYRECSNGDYSYKEGEYYSYIKDGKDLLEGLYVDHLTSDYGFFLYTTRNNECFLIKDGEILTKDTVAYCRTYSDGNYSYTDFDGWEHLIVNGKDLLEGLKAINLHSYEVWYYVYETLDNKIHFIRNGKDLFEGLDITKYMIEPDGDYQYKVSGSNYVHYIKEGTNIIAGTNYLEYHETKDGTNNYWYKTEDGYWHFIKDGKDLLEGLGAIECIVLLDKKYGDEIKYQTSKDGGNWRVIRTNELEA